MFTRWQNQRKENLLREIVLIPKPSPSRLHFCELLKLTHFIAYSPILHLCFDCICSLLKLNFMSKKTFIIQAKAGPLEQKFSTFNNLSPEECVKMLIPSPPFSDILTKVALGKHIRKSGEETTEAMTMSSPRTWK